MKSARSLVFYAPRVALETAPRRCASLKLVGLPGFRPAALLFAAPVFDLTEAARSGPPQLELDRAAASCQHDLLSLTEWLGREHPIT